MKKIYFLLALLACANAIYAQPLTWNVNIDNEQRSVTYVTGITITFENLGAKTISVDAGGVQQDLCLSGDKLEVKLVNEKLILGSCDPKREITKAASIQLKASDGKKCTINIRYSPAPAAPVGDNLTAYYDALVLKTGAPENIKKVWKKYDIETGTANLFLSDIPASSRISGSTGVIQSLGTSLGGLDVTKFADGLAKFLVKRAKEELTIAFFEDFKKELDKQEDIKDLFPNTKATLDLVNEEIYNYERYLLTLRENFESDFKALPDNITKIVDNHDAYFNSHKELKSSVLSGSKIAIGIRDKDHPGEIIASLDGTDLEGFDQKVRHSFLILQTFSEAFRDSATGENANYWISKKQFQQMARDSVWFRYFIGLSLETMKAKDTQLYNALITKTTFKPFKPTLDSMIAQTNRLNTLINTHKEDDTVTLETITGYVDATTDLLATVDNAIQLLKPGLSDREFLKNKFIPFIRNSNNLVGNISKEKYGSAIFNVIGLYKAVITDTEAEATQPGVVKWLTKYGGFMAAMISAENSDEVAGVIETYALPSGSARIKRESYFNISLNSYLGLSGGWDKANKLAPGVSAPVGVAFSWRTGNGGSFSIFPTLIDIGAITAFRFKDDTAQVAKIYLREIFSPGLFLSFGIRKLPVSINLGGQFAPLLERVVAGSNDYNIKRNFRTSLSFVVDIPLLNLYNRANKKPADIKSKKAAKPNKS